MSTLGTFLSVFGSSSQKREAKTTSRNSCFALKKRIKIGQLRFKLRFDGNKALDLVLSLLPTPAGAIWANMPVFSIWCSTGLVGVSDGKQQDKKLRARTNTR